MSRVTIIETKDGSHTLYREDIDETYHSQHGAITESLHVFIKNGIGHWLHIHPEANRLSILEIGFGTGLNAALTLQFSRSNNKEISFTTLEPYPIDLSIAHQINYFNQEPQLKNDFLQLHECTWSDRHVIDRFKFQKLMTKIEDFDSQDTYDIVFFDAFAPEKQPELWDEVILKKVYSLIKNGGLLTTYCAKGEFKRRLKRIGFDVYAVDGPIGGKREMVRAIKVNE